MQDLTRVFVEFEYAHGEGFFMIRADKIIGIRDYDEKNSELLFEFDGNQTWVDIAGTAKENMDRFSRTMSGMVTLGRL